MGHEIDKCIAEHSFLYHSYRASYNTQLSFDRELDINTPPFALRDAQRVVELLM